MPNIKQCTGQYALEHEFEQVDVGFSNGQRTNFVKWQGQEQVNSSRSQENSGTKLDV